eukprot:scaffold2033_cov72-Phaeocystis_antarctica.AAC.1
MPRRAAAATWRAWVHVPGHSRHLFHAAVTLHSKPAAGADMRGWKAGSFFIWRPTHVLHA